MSNQPQPANEVVEDILTNGFSSYDIFTWDTFDSCSQIDLIADIIATIASFEYDKALSLQENRGERLRQIEDCIRGHLRVAAEREGYQAIGYPLSDNNPNQ